jgi:type IV secretion system protein VirD4
MPVVLAAQNIPQLGRLYDRADNMIEQCQVQVYGAAQGNTTADTISRQTGTTTATTEVESYSRQWGTLHRQSTQITEQQHGRALLLPSEARQISGEHLVILRAGYPAVWAKKVKFWEERVWKHRSELTTS